MLTQKQVLKFAKKYLVNEAIETAESMQHLPYVDLRRRAEALIEITRDVDWIEEELKKIGEDPD